MQLTTGRHHVTEKKERVMTPVEEIILLGLNHHCQGTESNKDGMTVCVQAFASQQRTVRCHDTETSATDRKIQRTGRSQNWLEAD